MQNFSQYTRRILHINTVLFVTRVAWNSHQERENYQKQKGGQETFATSS